GNQGVFSLSDSRSIEHPGKTAPFALWVCLALFAAFFMVVPGEPVWAAEEKPAKKKDAKPGKKPAAAKPLSVTQLAQLNSAALFGVPFKINKGRFSVTYPGAGEFDKAFASRGRGRGKVIANIAEVKNASFRKLLIDGHSKGKPTLVGMMGGSALSIFELVDDYKISFRMRIPRIDGRGRFSFLLNHQGDAFVQTNFFQDIVIASKKSRVRSKNKKFLVPASRWFDKGPQGMPVSIVCKGGKLSISVGVLNGKKEEMVEVVSTVVTEPGPGKIGFSFEGVSFMMSSLRIAGKFPSAWAEKQMAVLKKAGKLITKMPEKKAAPAKKGLPKKGPDLSRPDPEAEEEL
ncbi:MAG: hypothetical protein MK479_06330, partial [Planctomycetes bacterium]|nr:hypothetical protein [Planctomycetota bacterium]